MNKKGFTLTELLGVIVVLAVIIGIAMMSATSIMNKSKNKLYREMEDNLKDVAVTCYLDQRDTTKCDTAGELIENGYFEDNKKYCYDKTREKDIEIKIVINDDDYTAEILKGNCGD